MELAGLGPQARFGDNTTEEPSVWLLIDHIKWDAWNSKKGMPQSVAMEQFMNILLVNGIIDKIPKSAWVGAGPPDVVHSVYTKLLLSMI
jgi:acyl-CoA-binding protein